jgi:glycosyltransferase involved in cell wall biosynthesis
MRVLQISIADANPNACTSAAYRIHLAVRAAGVDCTLLVRDKVLPDPTVRAMPDASLPQRLWWRLRAERIQSAMKPYRATRPKGLELFSDSRAGLGRAILPEMAGYDLFHLHWFRSFVDWDVLAAPGIAEKPVLFTLHDTAHFTGGCHYTNGCERFTQKCGACPQLGSTREHDLSRRNWERKKAVLSARRAPTHVAGCSDWIAAEARRSSLLGPLPVKTIHNGVDVEEFQPRDRAFARQLLGLPADAAVIMFIAAQLSNPRKGLNYLMDAVREVQCDRPLFLLSVGPGQVAVPANVRHVSVGAVNSERYLSIIYSAADLFVIPSLEENFALTGLEAAACGLPVIGFKVGGIPELVDDGVTGHLVPVKDARALGGKIAETLNNPTRCAVMGQASRQRVLNLFTENKMGERYRDLYAQMSQSKN